ncbi:helix-turn-helix transcriptional regulator [Mediterraneibacter catenae]|uniref:Helix-turn-helix transcriptional regulator n=1 Tax=Mediterraneibacter catenae TaxID=2594882 RepID=A0A5M9HZC9_9FIRM|nr:MULTISPECIES: helix-turn-helix domain-containing protein [Mediterraneibacter]KAA8502003.1 helix-turn-helix transcriptional regulator [Mediterraneibacter catenae]MDN0043769.1 helix-turn-helix domain-containing protein [Mediterraneibacter glycyrrhizinilyticus]
MAKSAYERYCEIRDKCELKDSDVAKGAGITKSTFSDWKAGRYTPKQDKMQKISDYLGVSVEYLMTGEEKEGGEKYYLNEETAEMAQALFENKDLRVLFDAAKDASPEDLKTTYDMLMALKRKERGENDF